MRTALIAVTLFASLAGPTESEACSISPNPYAHIFRPTSGKPAGHRPMISLWRTTKPVAVTQVKANCIQDTICKGTPVEVERVGNFMRPKIALPDGARIQVTHDGKLLADSMITTGASALPAWDGVAWVSAKQEKEGLCSPAGPVVRLKVKPTKANLDNAFLLVYTTKPDAAKPLDGVITIYSLGSNDEISIGNGFAMPDVFKAVPKEIFVRLGDGEGNFGPVIKLP